MALLVTRSNEIVKRASFEFLVVVVVVVDLGVTRGSTCRDVLKLSSGAQLRVLVLETVNSGVDVSRSCGGEVEMGREGRCGWWGADARFMYKGIVGAPRGGPGAGCVGCGTDSR